MNRNRLRLYENFSPLDVYMLWVLINMLGVESTLGNLLEHLKIANESKNIGNNNLVG